MWLHEQLVSGLQIGPNTVIFTECKLSSTRRYEFLRQNVANAADFADAGTEMSYYVVHGSNK
jgi:hypothetical protein